MGPRPAFPWSLEEVKGLGTAVDLALERDPLAVKLSFLAVYVFLQTFAIPGSAFLSILAGVVFGRVVGISIVTVAVVVGASNCFLLSSLTLRGLIKARFPERLAHLQALITENRGSLANYMAFLRLTPIVPNWFINIATPVAGVPFRDFALATLFGVLPATFTQVSMGCELHSMAMDDQSQSVFSPRSIKRIAVLLALGLLSLAPALWQKRKAKK